VTAIYSVDDFDYKRSVGRLISRTRIALLEHVSERLKALDLSAAQWSVVVTLAEGTATSPVEVARLLDYDPGALTRLVDRLEKKDIVRRSNNSLDRRKVMLELTDHGRALFPEILPLIVGVYNELLEGFTKAEVEQLEEFLTRMLRNA